MVSSTSSVVVVVTIVVVLVRVRRDFTVDGASGTGRSEKNRFQLTMTGEEAGLSYSITSALFDVATA